MIEYNFNELDNDFITCWCRYLLTGDCNLVMGDLEKLAELGQVNAIQEWYRFNEVGDNKKIDERAEKIGHNYNGLFVKARIGSKEESQIERQNVLLTYVDEKQCVSCGRSSYYELTDRARKCRKDIAEVPYIKDYYAAVNRALQIGSRTDDVVVLETANEMYSELADKIGIADTSRGMDRAIKKLNSDICSRILKDIKKEKKETGTSKLLENPRICFTLSKAILLFNDKHKQKPLAVELLKSLSKREYSDKLKESKNTKR